MKTIEANVFGHWKGEGVCLTESKKKKKHNTKDTNRLRNVQGFSDDLLAHHYR